MTYLAFDPGKSGGICALDARGNRVVLLVPMPVMTVRDGKSKSTEYDTDAIRRIIVEYQFPGAKAVLERQQDRQGQRRGGDSSVGAFMLLKGICIGVGMPVVEVHPTTWTTYIYRGMIEQCPSCGLEIVKGVKLVRERTVIRTRGKRAGKRDIELCRCCPKCMADIDGKLRSIKYCHDHFPGVSLRATKNCTTDADGLADALCIAAWEKETGA